MRNKRIRRVLSRARLRSHFGREQQLQRWPLEQQLGVEGPYTGGR